ncbi:phasin family protein [Micromonospora sp. KLBMP9576]|uniref:phasin family protein n=1 Tax=Micromonospora sp. KLBMP9576 TaxID=3424769 RepID=UPI003D8EF31C
MQDAWRAYLELAMGLTEAPRKKAQDTVRRLVGTGGATAAQLQTLAEELVSTGVANREALTKLVRFEVDRTLGAVGLATADEVAELTRRVHELERQLRDAKSHRGDPPPAGAPGPVLPVPAGAGSSAGPGAAEPAVPTSAPPAPVVRPAVAKKAVAKKAVAKKAVARRAPADLTPVEGDAARAARPVKKAPARKRPPQDEA